MTNRIDACLNCGSINLTLPVTAVSSGSTPDCACYSCGCHSCSSTGEIISRPRNAVEMTAVLRNLLLQLHSGNSKNPYWKELPDPKKLKPSYGKPPSIPYPCSQAIAKPRKIARIGHLDDFNPRDEEYTPLSPEELSQIETIVERCGIDTVAWYRSFRDGSSWGIYITRRGIELIAKALVGNPDLNLNQHDAERYAFKLLLGHEYYHFLVDKWALERERVCSAPMKMSYSDRKKTLTYSHQDIEEACANLFALEYAGKATDPAWRTAWEQKCARSPHAYQITEKDRTLDRNLAIAINPTLQNIASETPIMDTAEHFPAINIPIYLVSQ